MNLRRIRPKVGMRVTNQPMGGQWGTIIEVIDMRKVAKTASEKLNAKNSPFPIICVVQLDSGKTERWRHGRNVWFVGDDPGFRRPILKDPCSSQNDISIIRRKR